MLLASWRPGEEGGNAIYDLITGQQNPSGRLSQSWLRSAAHVRGPANPWLQYRQGDFDLQPYIGNVRNEADQGASPLFPFGFGFSYCQYSFGGLSVSTPQVQRGQNFTVSVTVTASGCSVEVDGSLVVAQLYYSQTGKSKYVRWRKMLLGFTKIQLSSAGTATAEVVVSVDEQMSAWDPERQEYVVEPSECTIMTGPDSATVSESTTIYVLP